MLGTWMDARNSKLKGSGSDGMDVGAAGVSNRGRPAQAAVSCLGTLLPDSGVTEPN